jgi:hypothetical protein
MSKNLIVSNLNVHSNFTPNCNSKNTVEKSITVRTSGVPQTDWLRIAATGFVALQILLLRKRQNKEKSEEGRKIQHK